MIPGFDQGTVVKYRVTATDVQGNWSSSNLYSYDIYPFVTAPNLVHLNVAGGSCEELEPYFDGFLPYDCCGEPGSLHYSCYPLYDYYETVIVLSTWGPWVCLDDFFTPNALRDWFDSGNKNYLLAGDNWLDQCFSALGDSIRDFLSGEIPYDYLGLDGYYSNINYAETGDEEGVSRLFAVRNDLMSGAMYEFLGDSLLLNYDPNYEIGASNWLDGLYPLEGARVSYWGLSGVLDSTLSSSQEAETLATAVYYESSNGNKSAFFAFDPLSLNTMAIGADTLHGAGYHWVGIYPQAPIPQALLWMNAIGAVDKPEAGLPSELMLFQNYPNPFNPATTIDFSLPRSGMVTLSVYDLLGKEVETILNGPLEAGDHTVQWDARHYSSGVYFIRLRMEGYAQTKKVTVLR